MGVPLRQQVSVATYLVKQKLMGVEKFPLVLMLEPLFRCNLACAGCGKIDYPDDILNKRLSVEDALAAVDDCGAPIVSIAGGEPLLHKELPKIVEGMIARKKYIYLCTNALLLKKRMGDFTPSPYLNFSIHLDGLQERHDASVCQDGVFERAVEVIKLALEKGFRVTVNCTLFQGETAEEVLPLLGLQVQREAPFVPVHGQKGRRLPRDEGGAHPPGVISPVGALHLDDVGAHVCQQQGAEGPRHDLAGVEDHHPLERSRPLLSGLSRSLRPLHSAAPATGSPCRDRGAL